MKKLISFIAALALTFSMCGSFSAFADSGIKNQILDSFNGGEYNKTDFHEGELKKIDKDGEVQRPKKSSYVDVVRNYYIDAPKGHSVYAYTKPDPNSKKQPVAYHGSKVLVWAEEDGWACISYYNENFEQFLGWVNADYISSESTCNGISFGEPIFDTTQKTQTIYLVFPEQEWSSFNFVGSKTKYVEISTPTYEADQFVAMDIYYKVISRNGVSDASGERNVYLNDGSGWEYIGSFEVNKDLEPVRIHINYEEPREIKAVAVIPTDPVHEACVVNQHVQWIYSAEDK